MRREAPQFREFRPLAPLSYDRPRPRNAVLIEIRFRQEFVRPGCNRLKQVGGQSIARHLPEAHLLRARIDVPRHATAETRISDEKDVYTARLKLLNEMIKLGAEYAFLRT